MYIYAIMHTLSMECLNPKYVILLYRKKKRNLGV
jgi:hypothetical protein